jgi:predicted nucleotide-binding protein (sugar kinase/HSP70/actin superfamily)
MRIGIPRGLLYYQYLPMWATFFRELGAEVVTSPATTERMVAVGCSRAVGDLCLPVKVFCGHVSSMANDCDYVFVPAIRSPRKEVNSCPKFIGLPDLVRAIVPECPPIMDPDVDANNGRRGLLEAAYGLGPQLGIAKSGMEMALDRAFDSHREFRAQMECHGLYPPEAIEKMLPGFGSNGRNGGPVSDITVAVIGHRYILYDQHVTHRLLERLHKLGVNTVVAETVGEEQLRASMLELVDKPYWGYEEEIVGAGAHFLRSDVDGVICVAAFGCGPDSLMLELVQRGAGRVGKRFLKLVFDEHTAEGGLVTRVEAFVDMVRRAKSQPSRRAPLRSPCSEEKEWIGALGLPNMGNIAAALRKPAEMLGVPIIVPQVTQRTLSLGVRHSPEFACVPFKVILGCFLECLEEGADTLFMVTSSDACRMGYYSKVHEEILRDLGYEFKFLRHRSSDKGILGVLRTVRRCTNHASWMTVVSAYRLGTAKLRALDDLERKASKVRPVAVDKSETERVYREGMDAVDEARDRSSVKRQILA